MSVDVHLASGLVLRNAPGMLKAKFDEWWSRKFAFSIDIPHDRVLQ